MLSTALRSHFQSCSILLSRFRLSYPSSLLLLRAMAANHKSQSTSENALASALVALAASRGNQGDAAALTERFEAAVAGSLVAGDPSTSTSPSAAAAADEPAFLEAARRLLLRPNNSSSSERSKDALLSAVASWLRSSYPAPFRLGAALGPAVAAAASAAAGGGSLGELRGELRAAAAAYAVAVRAGGIGVAGGGGGARTTTEAPPSPAVLAPLPAVSLSPLRPHSPAPGAPPPPVEHVLALGSPYHTPRRSPGKLFAPFDRPPKEERQQQSQQQLEATTFDAGASASSDSSSTSFDFDDDELIAAPLALFALWAPRLSEAAQVEAARCTLAAVSKGCPWMREEIGGEAEEEQEESSFRGRWPAAAASAAARSLAHSRLRGSRARAAAAQAAAALHARAARELDAAGLISARAAVAVLQR